MDKPAEILLFDFLTEQINALVGDEVLCGVELHDTVYQPIGKANRLVRVSEAVGDLSPGPEMVVREYDVQLMLVIASRVEGKDKEDRQPALVDVFQMQKALYSLIIGDSTLGARVCDSVIGRGPRGYDVLDGEPFAVANMPLVINPSGETLRR